MRGDCIACDALSVLGLIIFASNKLALEALYGLYTYPVLHIRRDNRDNLGSITGFSLGILKLASGARLFKTNGVVS